MKFKKVTLIALCCVTAMCSFFYFTDTKIEGEIMWQISQNDYGYRVYRHIYNDRVHTIEDDISNNVSFDDYTIKANWTKDSVLSNIQYQFVFSNETCTDITKLHHDPFPMPDNGRDWFMSHYTDSYPLTDKNSLNNNYELRYDRNGFYVHSDSLDDHWIYIVSKNVMPSKYAVEFDYTSKTAICEQLQIDIWAYSLADRFRVISAYGEKLFFDAVQKGYFLKRFYENDCKIRINETNHIRLEVDEKHIVYYVNGEKELCVSMGNYPNKQGHLIILFWNNVDKVPIDIEIGNFTIYTEKRVCQK